ncbi:beta-ketoacyl-[acyl-carrier-protein] synthase family protein [Dyella sp. A6]|uniref:beta-ketoacyl-[acyl-carrier-protein] synthase family protein n=1 Tax=Dyella aluminiiresistens TaxID=3069105 RepID=UPI002E77B1E2|nr:beta-ketoacyl-[acyl-carrier-protein] synthase family protein [Dyella sp. A6]
MRLVDANGLPRVVVTGTGSLSCLGAGNHALFDGLRHGRCGLRSMAGFAALDLQARVGGPVDLAGLPEPPRKLRRFLAAPGLYAWHALNEALAQAGLTNERLQRDDCGLVLGGGAALSEHEAALDSHRARGVGRLSPFIVPRGMSSALSASVAHAFGIGGISLTISSACTSSAHAIGQAMELIQLGRQQVVITGGAEELHDSTAMWFDAMHALSPQHDPALASRPYHPGRDGFVLAAGAGVLVLESLQHAMARGAVVLAELAGYGSATDAASMVGPGADGITRALRQAIDRAGTLPGYINTHACSTPQGDLAEWQAIRTVFAERDLPVPPLSSIKGLIGHAPAAAGALDAIASLLMMQHGMLLPGRVPVPRDEAFADAPLPDAPRALPLDSVLSGNFGFGGSCTALLFRRCAEADA